MIGKWTTHGCYIRNNPQKQKGQKSYRAEVSFPERSYKFFCYGDKAPPNADDNYYLYETEQEAKDACRKYIEDHFIKYPEKIKNMYRYVTNDIIESKHYI